MPALLRRRRAADLLGGAAGAYAVALLTDAEPALPELGGERLVVQGGGQGADVGVHGQQRLLVALGHDAALADDDHLVGDQLDLVEQVARQQDGAAARGVRAQQVAHPADAGRVEPVGGLVEDQHGRVAEQGVGDPQPLAHAEGVVAHAPPGLGRRERDQLEHLVDPARGQAHGAGAEGQHLATGAADVLGGGVEEDPDVEAGVGDVAVVVAADGDLAGRGGGEPAHHPHRGRLAGAVRPQEAGHPPRLAAERDVVDGAERAVGLGQPGDLDHASHRTGWTTRGGSAPGRGREDQSRGWPGPGQAAPAEAGDLP
jgi:hypothetical protein